MSGGIRPDQMGLGSRCLRQVRARSRRSPRGFEHGYADGNFLWVNISSNFQYISSSVLFTALVMVVVSRARPPPERRVTAF